MRCVSSALRRSADRRRPHHRGKNRGTVPSRRSLHAADPLSRHAARAPGVNDPTPVRRRHHRGRRRQRHRAPLHLPQTGKTLPPVQAGRSRGPRITGALQPQPPPHRLPTYLRATPNPLEQRSGDCQLHAPPGPRPDPALTRNEDSRSPKRLLAAKGARRLAPAVYGSPAWLPLPAKLSGAVPRNPSGGAAIAFLKSDRPSGPEPGDPFGDATLVRSGPCWTIAFAQQHALPTSSQRPARLVAVLATSRCVAPRGSRPAFVLARAWEAGTAS